MNYLQTILHWFNQLETPRKIGFIGSIVLILTASILLSLWVLSPSYAILFNHLDEQDAHNVLSQLEQDNIPYQVNQDGSEILIDKHSVAKTRLKIMGSGVQLAGNVGFELFDKNDFGMTDFSQKINYQRALQGELERTIAGFEEIRQARVHLVIPEQHLFDTETNQPKAAITLQLKQPLTFKQVQSIQRLVAASVTHLHLKNVVVVDQNGNTLSERAEETSSTHFSSKKTLEQYLNDKVTQMLHTIFASEQVVVKIDVAINYDELQRERINPNIQGQVTHEKEIKHTTLDKKGKTKGNQDLTFEKTYEIGHEKELFKRASGTIEHLSVSVVLPQNTDAKTLNQVKDLIKNTVGFNEKRGDKISVEALIALSPSLITPSPILNKPIKQIENLPDLKWIAGFVLLALISVFGLVARQKIRHKNRTTLLLELTQWLNNHE